jgi:hypothetical protein
MTRWNDYGRRHAHGIGLETAKGHAVIEGGYADQHLRVTVQVGAQPAQQRLWGTMAHAQAWAEAQLCEPLELVPAGDAAGSVGTSVPEGPHA